MKLLALRSALAVVIFYAFVCFWLFGRFVWTIVTSGFPKFSEGAAYFVGVNLETWPMRSVIIVVMAIAFWLAIKIVKKPAHASSSTKK